MKSPMTMSRMEMPVPSLVREPSTGRSRFLAIFTVTVIAVTVVAVALAVFAPQLDSHSFAVPADWGAIYDQQLTTVDTSQTWDGGTACQASDTAQGLFFGEGNMCEFVPSRSGTLESGFALVADLAPAAEVEAQMIPGIRIARDVRISFDQQGKYLVCSGGCSPTRSGGGVYETGDTIGWHADALVPNTIQVLYTPDHEIELYANKTFVTRVYLGLPSDTTLLEIGAASGGEALYTHVAIYVPA